MPSELSLSAKRQGGHLHYNFLSDRAGKAEQTFCFSYACTFPHTEKVNTSIQQALNCIKTFKARRNKAILTPLHWSLTDQKSAQLTRLRDSSDNHQPHEVI